MGATESFAFGCPLSYLCNCTLPSAHLSRVCCIMHAVSDFVRLDAFVYALFYSPFVNGAVSLIHVDMSSPDEK